MRILEFNVERQALRKAPGCDFNGLVAGSCGHLRALFTFSEDWAGYLKAAVFSDNSGEYAVPIKNGTCEVAPEVLGSTSFKVRVVGKRKDDMLPTSSVTIIQRRH